MTPIEVATILRQYNKWLRGNKDGPQLESREINQAINAAIEMIERLETAEKSDAESLAMYRKARDEREALRAKIAEMERQEPVAWGAFYFGGKLNGKLYSQCATEAQIDMYIADRHQSDDSNTFRKAPLYALPGAQPAPSVPDATWLPVPDKHPTFDPVDLKLADGSVLCGCVPQSDGDYWWKGPGKEVFIDPRYAPVTHWRLSAALGSKP